MIPARMGSKRVPKKNIRLLAGEPLISYSISSAIKSKVFDEIYLNSEDEVFRSIAKSKGISFYKRDNKFAQDNSNNDDFLIDFVKNISCDIVIQLLPTSPFITSSQIRNFTNTISEGKSDTLVSVVNHKIAGIYKGKPINFSQNEPHISSQQMTPVQTYATVLMGWKKESLLNAFKNFGFGYHGQQGKTDYFVIDGLAKIDIDEENDFQLAEFVMKFIKEGKKSKPVFYEVNSGLKSEINVPKILENDGILRSDFNNENLPLSDIEEIIENEDNSVSWCRRIINTENNSATLISQLPGEGNRLHYHPNWNEWWYIIKGQWQWQINQSKMTVKEGEMVFIPKNTWHKITATGDKPAVRLAVSREDVEHVYKNEK